MKIMIPFTLIVFLSIWGCRSGYYKLIDYQSVLKVDSHVHLNSDKSFFVDQAVKDNFMLITLGVDHGDSAAVQKQQALALQSVKKYPGRVFYGATFFFDTTGWKTPQWSERVIAHLKKDIADGAVSVKLWKNIGMTVRERQGAFIMADDPGIKPVIDFIISRNLPVTGHLGEPRNCWLPVNEMTVSSDSGYFTRNPQYHMYLHPEYPTYEAQINARDHLLELHPDLHFIGCHLGSLEWNIDELAKRLDQFPNMVVDLSARICHLQVQSLKDRNHVRNFCIKYQDRLLYGTDMADNGTANGEQLARQCHAVWLDDWKYFTSNDLMVSKKFRGEFRGLQLPKEVVDKIYCRNAILWYKLPAGKL